MNVLFTLVDTQMCNKAACWEVVDPEIFDQEQTTAFILSEVLKALRLHPDAKTAVREHFIALENQVEREWLQQLESGNGHAE